MLLSSSSFFFGIVIIKWWCFSCRPTQSHQWKSPSCPLKDPQASELIMIMIMIMIMMASHWDNDNDDDDDADDEPQLSLEGSPSRSCFCHYMMTHWWPHPSSFCFRKILHLTDVHIDLSYMEGAEAACGWVCLFVYWVFSALYFAFLCLLVFLVFCLFVCLFDLSWSEQRLLAGKITVRFAKPIFNVVMVRVKKLDSSLEWVNWRNRMSPIFNFSIVWLSLVFWTLATIISVFWRLPMCCMNTSGLAASEETAAGYWGDYRVAPDFHILTDIWQFVGEYF